VPRSTWLRLSLPPPRREQGCNASFSNWAAHEPHNGIVPSHCAMIAPTGEWWASLCNQARSCLCERPRTTDPLFDDARVYLSALADSDLTSIRLRARLVPLLISLLATCHFCIKLSRSRRRKLRVRPVASTEAALRRAVASESLNRAGAAVRQSLEAKIQMFTLLVLKVCYVLVLPSCFFVASSMLSPGYSLWPWEEAPLQYRWLPVLPLLPALWFLIVRPVDVSYVLYFGVWSFLSQFVEAVVLFAASAIVEDNGYGSAHVFRAVGAVFLLNALLCLRSVLRYPRGLHPRSALNLQILGYRVCFSVVGLLVAGYSLVLKTIEAHQPNVREQEAYDALLTMGITWSISGLLLMAPRLRLFMRRGLTRLGSTTTQRQAAVIAGLIGAGKPKANLLIDAEEKFRALPFARMTAADLERPTAGRSPAACAEWARSFRERTVPCRLGECDAFLSHSWQDDGKKKWQALSMWAHRFQHEHGRMPTLWLDVACIEQSQVNETLALLPIFVSGCEHLLMAAGPTYATRLWCAMELFTFLFMGGASAESMADSLSRIEVLILDDSADSTRSMLALFRNFDVRSALCHKPDERESMLGVIESALGSYDEFNSWMRVITDRAFGFSKRVRGSVRVDPEVGLEVKVESPPHSRMRVLSRKGTPTIDAPGLPERSDARPRGDADQAGARQGAVSPGMPFGGDWRSLAKGLVS